MHGGWGRTEHTIYYEFKVDLNTIVLLHHPRSLKVDLKNSLTRMRKWGSAHCLQKAITNLIKKLLVCIQGSSNVHICEEVL